MSEQAPPPKLTIAQHKESLRAELAALANKVPQKVNAGGIQTTRQWIADNEQIALIARGGKKRLSRHALTEIVAKAKHWHEPEAA